MSGESLPVGNEIPWSHVIGRGDHRDRQLVTRDKESGLLIKKKEVIFVMVCYTLGNGGWGNCLNSHDSFKKTGLMA